MTLCEHRLAWPSVCLDFTYELKCACIGYFEKGQLLVQIWLSSKEILLYSVFSGHFQGFMRCFEILLKYLASLDNQGKFETIHKGFTVARHTKIITPKHFDRHSWHHQIYTITVIIIIVITIMIWWNQMFGFPRLVVARAAPAHSASVLMLP